MATDPVVATLDLPVSQRRSIADFAYLWDYWALTKPEVNFLILITTFAGFYLACAAESRSLPYLTLINTIVGTMLVASGAATLNQFIERRFDAQMRRTGRRPLAAGRLQPAAVLRFGIWLSVAGSFYLALAVNGLASVLAAFTLLSYLFLYTPLKRKSPLCTLVGAIPGAMPPLIGWAAASGRLTSQAWILFAVIFLWQFPHFMAIAWMYREDYDRAVYLVLPSGSSRPRFAFLQTLLPLMLLVPLTLIPAFPGRPTWTYAIGAALLGFGYLYYGVLFSLRRSAQAARRLLAASIVYLPLLFALMMTI